MSRGQTAKIAEPISGDKLYQDRARRAFPLLVRQAEAHQPIYYSSLAEELGMPNPRNLNYVLGSIGQTIENLSAVWKETVPPIQCLVINKNTNLPGEGIGWFLVKKAEFAKLPRSKQREIVNGELARIWAYPKWLAVLEAVDLLPTTISFKDDNRAAAALGVGGGEGDAHRAFKIFVAKNPERFDLPGSTPCGSVELPLPSGDSLDVSFQTGSEWVAAEVKSSISSDSDIVRGLYQCVKYQAVMQAVEAAENRERTGRAILVLQGKFPGQLVALKNILGVTVFDGVEA
ncbi:hypothetical protein I8G32_03950 [Rhodopseudomonas palustris]|uniref:Uncharacterized protein n=1 Tax=Rhodopseudomonas palustris (strain ATCC BAA-98 / CGA009) TaxID=258594 RepID=A0AAE9Y157_RHOPA|nr:hypothetical protein [Rhodopseudomonas palustris]OPF95037.1 hypothetical protein B1S06_06325 [Rhodopseudomonas palustris]QQM05381.1 hypothetical protein I8G32_03950 [Rhodopseudomonas palustris]RJF68294.1 hypothetical protein D4Q71_03275 [Rhodopseudomonas palustris]WAB76721.1 hypothetical protein OR798_19830 [Rhodopseudomonas palustris]WCL94006.1 hypothetical protein TX73_019825 [Rhodopseudomonas palustris CGA009]